MDIQNITHSADENTLYHADTSRIGKSGLDLIHKAPAYYWAKYLDPNREREEPTKALRIGSAFHMLLLEGEKFPHRYAIMPEFSGTGMKARKEEWLEVNAGKEFITADEYDGIQRMRDAVMKHPLVPSLLAQGIAERKTLWEEPETGAKCKFKPDWIDTNNGLLVDVKTTADASPAGFGKSCWNYRYHVQSAFYMDGAEHAGLNVSHFVFIAVETTAPYLCAVYYADAEMLEAGRREYLADLRVYLECLRTKEWPGYPTDMKPISLPGWATKSRN
jgi:hypothetical protein